VILSSFLISLQPDWLQVCGCRDSAQGKTRSKRPDIHGQVWGFYWGEF